MDNNSHIRNVKVFITQPVTPEDFGQDFLRSFSRARDAGARRLLLQGHNVVSWDVFRCHPRTLRDIARGVRRFTVSVNVLVPAAA
jgi:hypothetical protein